MATLNQDPKVLVVSQDFEYLAQCLASVLRQRSRPLAKQWILVPSIAWKSWLWVQLCRFSPDHSIAGIVISTLDEMLYQRCSQIPTKLEMRCLIARALDLEPFSSIVEQFSSHTKIELVHHLADLFFSYGKYGIALDQKGWQIELFRFLFSGLEFALPFQILPDMKADFIQEIHCFGFDHLPLVFWDFLLRFPSCTLYQFSPCSHFWEDVRTDREQRDLIFFGKKMKASTRGLSQMHEYFVQMPPLLANWGHLGRETMEMLDQFLLDREPVYKQTKQETLLGALQSEIVCFEQGLCKTVPLDDSVRILKVGASKLHEVEVLQEEIAFLAKEKGVLFSEMLVLSPRIEEYAPLIEFVFSRSEIPYRFASVSIEKQSSFHQGLLRLISLVSGKWSLETISAFLETPSFSRKWRLGPQQIASWISWVREIFLLSSDWEEGFGKMLEKSTMLLLGPKVKILSMNDLDSLEQCLTFFQSLEEDLSFCKQSSLSLEQWAVKWMAICEKYLWYDFDHEADICAWNAFNNGIKELRESRLGSSVFPFSMIETVFTRSVHASIHSNHLHALCCASIQVGAIVPSKAIFILGMDEESFPRKSKCSSLNLIDSEPSVADIDRYLFLQIVLSAQEYLRISYCHLCQEDGKTIEPSSLAAQLISQAGLQPKVKTLRNRWNLQGIEFSLKPQELIVPCKKLTIHLSDLVFFAKHPWKYFLQKTKGIYLEDRLERSFGSIRSEVLRTSLKWPLESVLETKAPLFPKMFQQAFFVDVERRELDLKKVLLQWGKKVETISFLETAQGYPEFPPLEISLDDGTIVSLVGDVPYCLDDGALHFGDDKIGSLLKSWPEILSVLVALNSSTIYFLKTSKVKSVANPKHALKQWIAYYLRCSKDLSPLLPDWADHLLRKAFLDFSFEFEYEDVVNEWIFSRLEIDRETLFKDWGFLRDHFSELIALYPMRKASETV